MLYFRGEIVFSTMERSSISYLSDKYESCKLRIDSREINYLSETSSALIEINSTLTPQSLSTNILSQFNQPSSFSIMAVGTTKTLDVEYRDLARRWGIEMDLAKITVDSTTQLSLHSSDYPSLSKRYSTNDRMMRHPRIS